MKTAFLFLLIICSGMIISCNRTGTEAVSAEKYLNRFGDPANAATLDSIPLSADYNNLEKKFIRTADMHFKVKKVDEAISEIEKKAIVLGGFTCFSETRLNVRDSFEIITGADSAMQIIHYNTDASLVVRVPDGMLDSLLVALKGLSCMTITRQVKAEDISLQELANSRQYWRSGFVAERLNKAIVQKGKKLADIENAGNLLEQKTEATDHAEIATLGLEDAVHFSTVTIKIYQDPTVQYSAILREKKIPEYQTPFFTQIAESLVNGMDLLKDLIVSLVKYWVVFLFCAIGYMVYRRFTLVPGKVKAAPGSPMP